MPISTGIDPNIPAWYFLSADENCSTFTSDFDEQRNSFASITQETLLTHMTQTSDQKEVPNKLNICVKAGFEVNSKGFSARHILKHLNPFHDYYQKPTYTQDLIKITRAAFSEINTFSYDSADMALSLAKNKAYVFACDIKIQFDNKQHVLITLYPDGKDKLVIGTLYLISKNAFNAIKAGSNRYQPILAKQQAVDTQNCNNNTQPDENKDTYSQVVTALTPSTSTETETDVFDENVSLKELEKEKIIEVNEDFYQRQQNLKKHNQRMDKMFSSQIVQYDTLIKSFNKIYGLINDANSEVHAVSTQLTNIANSLKKAAGFDTINIDADFIQRLHNLDLIYKNIENKLKNIAKKLNEHSKITPDNDLQNRIELYDIFLNDVNNEDRENVYLKLASDVNAVEKGLTSKQHYELWVQKWNTAWKAVSSIKDNKAIEENYLKAILSYTVAQRKAYHQLADSILLKIDAFMQAMNCANHFFGYCIKHNIKDITQYKHFNELISIVHTKLETADQITIAIANTHKESLIYFYKQYNNYYPVREQLSDMNKKQLRN